MTQNRRNVYYPFQVHTGISRYSLCGVKNDITIRFKMPLNNTY